ncbi:RNA methyltransferase [Bacillaceae bacterium S4-13-56]
MNDLITSKQNPKMKEWKKLKQKKERYKTQRYLVEGEHLIEEAIQSNVTVETIIIEESYQGHVPISSNIQIYTVTKTLFQEISDTESPQGIAGIVVMNAEELPAESQRILLLDRIQDPGNLGTMIRTADAAGFDAVVLGDGCVDLFNSKVIRSTQGSLFHLPFLQKSLEEIIPTLKKSGFQVWGTALENSSPYQEATPTLPLALLLGNEGAGVSKDLLELTDHNVKIPIYGKAESLNVSIAAAILMYYVR